MGTGAKLDGQYGYRPAPEQKKPTPSGGVGSVGMFGSHQWDPRKVGQYVADTKVLRDQWLAAHPKGSQEAADAYAAGQLSGTYADNHPEAFGVTTPSTSGGGSGSNPMMDVLLKQYNQNPFAALSMQLLENSRKAQTQGAGALDSLISELNARKNPYADLHFQDATATANPLAAYMQASGAGTGQVDAYSQLLQQLSQNAVNADSNRAAALGAAFNADTASRVSNAQTEQAGFLEQLQAQLLSQQNNIAQQQQKYKNDLAMQMAQLSMKYGIPMPKGVV